MRLEKEEKVPFINKSLVLKKLGKLYGKTGKFAKSIKILEKCKGRLKAIKDLEIKKIK